MTFKGPFQPELFCSVFPHCSQDSVLVHDHQVCSDKLVAGLSPESPACNSSSKGFSSFELSPATFLLGWIMRYYYTITSSSNVSCTT